ncbi:MAG TPA: TonB-dependent receptor [Vicinamibacterales bacterium]|nr:TonB-dependent receptor [Vicinamibacterales bacterium]
MPRFSTFMIAALLCLPAWSHAQTRTTGQIVGTVRDATGAVVPNSELVLIDTGTGATRETNSAPDGGFVFPNLQPGTYSLTASAAGFSPVTLEQVIVQTSRSTDVVIQFQVAGVSEEVRVVGRTEVVETSSNTVSNTVMNEQIAKLPLQGRNILEFALLVPGSATSAGSRFSEYNGLPGGAINITLDGINNNSARFRSGGTSFFVFAPVRLGAIEEVTVSTAGLGAEAGAEGAVQLQFVTKRGSNAFRGQVFDQIRNDKLNANTPVNAARGLPKTELRQHEWGANIGGPILRNKVFFFANYEQLYAPGESTQSRTVLTPEAQQGVFRYTATNGSIQTVNLLDIARAGGFPSAIDPFIASQLQVVNSSLSGGDLASNNLFTNTFRFINENIPNSNIYPTARVDYQVNPNLAIRGVLNLHWRDLPRNPQFPGLDPVNSGFTSTYYILSTGADWTIRPNLFNQISFGGQSNYEEFNPGNTPAVYSGPGGNIVSFPLGLTSPTPTNNVLPIPRNNPVFNISDNLTWLKGNHTFTFGGTIRHTYMYETIGGQPPGINLGVASGDPASGLFNATTIPGVRTADLATANSLYAFLTGRISGVNGTYGIDEDTKVYRQGPTLRREAQTVGGLYAQDQWRLTPRLTLNYGLRWEFSGAARNPNELYSSPTPADLFGPSTTVFQPGVLDGTLDPQILLQPEPYKSDLVNPAPNVGVVWSPDKREGWLGRLLGESVYRANVGVNYYDEGLIVFQSAAGNGPGTSQSVTLTPGMPGFPPGGLTLESTLPPFAVNPASFSFPVPMSDFTFVRGHSSFDPDIRTPYVTNWTLSYQREVWRDAAIEVRYVGNRGSNLWRSYNINETNIFENGFLQEFQSAQRNLLINQANGLAGFANNGLPGQASLPIFETAFGPRGSQGALPGGSGFTNGTFVTLLQQGQAGRLATSLANNSLYLCRMVGSALPACGRLGYNAAGPYAMNVFLANPFAAGFANATTPNANRILTDEAESKYDALQLQLRQRLRNGLTVTANYTYAHARTDRFADSASAVVDYMSLRDKGLNWGPTVYALRHNFQAYWTYELPFGRDRAVDIQSPVLNQILGGWALNGIARIQSGRPFLLTSGRWTVNQQDAGVVLRGITVDDLQKMVNVRPGPNGNVFFFDERLIGPDGRANPDLLAPPTTPGEFGQRVYLYGPGLTSFDLGVGKTFRVNGSQSIYFDALFINAFNTRNTAVGGTGGATHSIDSTTFGQSTTTAIGPRNIQFRLQFNF